MIRAVIHDTGRGPCRSLALSTLGHARADVCNAVSMLVQTVAAYLTCLEDECPAGLVVRTSFGDGRFSLDAESVDCSDCALHDRLDAAHAIAELGLLQLQSQEASEIEVQRAESAKDVGHWRKMHFLAPV